MSHLPCPATPQAERPDGRRDQATADLESEPEEVPVGEEFRRGGRELGGPPPVRKQGRGPAAHEQENHQHAEHRGESAPTTRHLTYSVNSEQ